MLALARVKPSGDPDRDRIKKETIREECLQHFMEGLNDPVRQRVMSVDTASFDEAVTLALKEEQVERHVTRKVFQRVVEIEDNASDQEDEGNPACKKDKASRRAENFTDTRPKNSNNNSTMKQALRNESNVRYNSQQKQYPCNNNFARHQDSQFFGNPQSKPRFNQQYNTRNFNVTNEPVCYKCKRTGHYARQYRIDPYYLNDDSDQPSNNFFRPHNNYQQNNYQPTNRGVRGPFNQQTTYYNQRYIANRPYLPIHVTESTFPSRARTRVRRERHSPQVNKLEGRQIVKTVK